MPITIKRMIDAPPDVVFATYTDPARLPEWQPGVKGLRAQTGPLDQAGTSYVLDQPGPEMRITVLRVEAPSLHEQLEALPWFGWIGTARFDALQNGRTRFTYRYATIGSRRWLAQPLVLISALLYGRTEFTRLKRVAEDLTKHAD
jgi:uncharacterized protein YndB with AHSA1/START domain